jgi:purine-binding chemotaxis protein CheW
MNVAKSEAAEAERYLVFHIEGVRYGTRLLGVREVIEYVDPKPVPRTQANYLGVINIRGEIIGVVDLAPRLGQSQGPKAGGVGSRFLMIVETPTGNVACVVDKVELVAAFAPGDIDTRRAESRSFPQFTGIARYKDDLVNIVDLPGLVEGHPAATA